MATTALALLSFVWGGHTDRAGNYRPQVARARDWLTAQSAGADVTALCLTVWAFLELAIRTGREEDRARATAAFARIPGGSVAGRRMLTSHPPGSLEPFGWYMLAHHAAAALQLPGTGDSTVLEQEAQEVRARLQPAEVSEAESELSRYLRQIRPESFARPEAQTEADLRHLCLHACFGDALALASELRPLQEATGRDAGRFLWGRVAPETATASAAFVFARIVYRRV